MAGFDFTEEELLSAVEKTYPNAAVLRQVTLDDAESLQEWEAAIGVPGAVINAFSRRIDGLMLLHGKRTAIEVKVSRTDYKNETVAKRRVWRKFAHRFVYLTPPGLLREAEIPDGCGLWELDGKKIRIVVKAKVAADVPDFPDSFVRTILFRLHVADGKVRKNKWHE